MIITKKYGSYVFLGEIITDLELNGDEVRSFENIKEYKITAHGKQVAEKELLRLKELLQVASEIVGDISYE